MSAKAKISFKAGDTVKAHGSVFTVLSLHRKGKNLCVKKLADASTTFKRASDCALATA